jgi:opacity protein-like surface antigen
MVKPPFLLLLIAAIGFAQSFRFGVEGGIPLTSAFVVGTPAPPVGPFFCGTPAYSPGTRRYTVGATAELGLPFHLGIRADLLYKRQGFDSAASGCLPASIGYTKIIDATTANSWEIPLLAKYSLGKLGPLRPYVEGGVTFRALQGVQQQKSEYICLASCTLFDSTQTGNPAELSHKFTNGITAGAGLEFRHLLAGVFGEIRYTRWTADAFSAPDGGLNSTRNQADLLVGVTF